MRKEQVDCRYDIAQGGATNEMKDWSVILWELDDLKDKEINRMKMNTQSRVVCKVRHFNSEQNPQLSTGLSPAEFKPAWWGRNRPAGSQDDYVAQEWGSRKKRWNQGSFQDTVNRGKKIIQLCETQLRPHLEYCVQCSAWLGKIK